MSITKEQAATWFETMHPPGPAAREMYRMAAKALRPVSRERVEKVFFGCEYCDEEWGTCSPATNRFTMPPNGGIRFCPMCGLPLTDEAVDMMLERWKEAVKPDEG